jgi:hypothetical protein
VISASAEQTGKSPEAGPRVAAIISIVESCRRLSIPISDYLASVLPEIADRPSSQTAKLAPAAWASRIGDATDIGRSVVGKTLVINLVIGFLTPPRGMNLFVAQGISKQSLENIVKQNMPFRLVLIVVMFITMLFPDTILFLPNYLK